MQVVLRYANGDVVYSNVEIREPKREITVGEVTFYYLRTTVGFPVYVEHGTVDAVAPP